MTNPSTHLAELAERIATAYVDQTEPAAILLTGSAAEGTSDYFSDLDLIAYYERLPPEHELAASRTRIGVANLRVSPGSEPGSMVVEEYVVRGIECQVAHVTISSWERDMASVLDQHMPATLTEKAIIGLLYGAALHGSTLIGAWQSRAESYPAGLARATIEHHLRFFPLWLAAERWDSRDATIFLYQMAADSSLNLLAVLAGLNRRYFSAFQFKRLHQFVRTMQLVPERLADRLDELFSLDLASAGIALERLVNETVTLVEAHMLTISTVSVRRHIGVRHRPWIPLPLSGLVNETLSDGPSR